MIEGGLRLVLGGIVLLLVSLVVLALSPGQPWIAVAAIVALAGASIAVWGFLAD